MEPLSLSEFPKSDPDTWFRTAQQQLKGDDPFRKLAWETYDLKNLKPYYDMEDTKGLNYLIFFFQNIPSHRWKLYEKVQVSNEKEANEQALTALIGGCDGIIFEVQNNFTHEGLFKDIDLNICDVSIVSSEKKVRGTSGMNITNTVSQDSSIKSPQDQIEDLLSKLKKSHTWIYRHSFPDFFLEIATVRALRYLLDIEKKTNSKVLIHTSVPLHSSNDHQWFLNTTAGLASILGGSHSIDMPTAIGQSRTTRNVGNLIREESGIEFYTDQCGGSYLVESLTHQIIQQVKGTIK